MSELQDFRTDLLQRVQATAAQGEVPLESFVTDVAGQLVEAEELSDWTPCFYRDRGYRRKELIVDGCLIDDVEVDSSVSLILAHFDGGKEMPALSVGQASSDFDKGINFLEDAIAGRLHEELEPSRPETDLAAWLAANRGRISSVRLFLLSDCLLKAQNRELPEKRIGDIRIDLHVWDIERLFRAQSTGGREPIEIDLRNFVPEGLPAIRASIGENDYDAYLCSIPGSLLADLYDKYGSRLLEGNVRSYLSAKPAVNKGIRNTILNEPSRFFAYNNGVAATATSAVVEECGPAVRLVKLRDLQIVNGGQTTASLFTTRRKDHASLSSIFVPMKLSVVTEEQATEIIPLISRYANSQNKVSEADLFANHPLHRRLEELSRRIWTPQEKGATYATKWFYERARGQYVNEQAKLSKANKKTFELQHPKHQVITKTDLAKYENSWARLPYVVSLGAQKNFAKFAERIAPEWERSESEFNELWFKQIVAKAILFQSTEKVVSSQKWYQGGYRANIVTYSVALLSQTISGLGGKVLNFDLLWKRQELPEELTRQLGEIAYEAFQVIVNPPAEFANITEWCKKEACWKSLCAKGLQLTDGTESFLVDLGEARASAKDARGTQKLDNTLALITQMVSKPPGYWRRASVWESDRHILSVTESGVLALIATKRGFVPSDKQAVVLAEAERKLVEEGFK